MSDKARFAKTLIMAGVAAGATAGTGVLTMTPIASAETEAAEDPFAWLEQVTGARALGQVHAWNVRSERELSAYPRYAEFQKAAQAILADSDKVIAPAFIGDHAYRFRADASHPQGIWERSPIQAYRSSLPNWEPVLDLDALSRDEDRKWFWRGATCLSWSRCLIMLSDGGEDRAAVREFDLEKRVFVTDGIRLPATKGVPTHLEITDLPVAWIDADTALATRVWAPDTATAAGYGFVVKKVRRGQPIEQAQEVFRGKASDVSAMPLVLRDGDGKQVVLISRRLGFFEVEYHVVTAHGPVLLPLPRGVTARGLLKGQLVVTLREPWEFAGTLFPAGAVVALDVDTALRSPGELKPSLILAPNDRQTVDQVLVTRDRVLISLYTNVHGQLYTAALDERGDWSVQGLKAPKMSRITLGATSSTGNAFSYVTESYLTPATLYLGDAVTGLSKRISRGKPQFVAAGHVTEQFEATAADGTKIPYYLVRPHSPKAGGENPTILCAYGGLGYVNAPNYLPVTGKLWLENGGSLAIAHIRGGGEFGPGWHHAAQRARRQVAFDDFAAVARDLVARGFTKPSRLGIRGSSNGGLLAGVEFTQHPDLWNAALLNVGLYDMLKYPKMLAGASWMSEFGDPADPIEGAFLRGISPYHNLRAGTAYPPPLIMTATNDDRVHPGHSRKLAARLEQLGVPFYYNEAPDGGHGGKGEGGPCGSTERAALEFSYFHQRLGGT